MSHDARRHSARFGRKGMLLALTLLVVAASALFEGASIDGEPAIAAEASSQPAISMPATLSQTGLFTDLAALRPADDLVPYELNVPFWSDGALKQRWIKLPPGLSAEMRPDGAWVLPAGTTLIKHFEMPWDAAQPGSRRRLETRVLFVKADQTVEGATYRWRDDGSDADLVVLPAMESLPTRSPDGVASSQTWQYLSPADCRTCHTPLAGAALGITTAQLNREITLPDGSTRSQILAWRDRGLLQKADDPHLQPRLPRLDDAAVSVETRARAWLDVNCAQCHRPGGAPTETDLRFSTPLERQGLINARQRIDLGIDGARAIAPNDPWRSLVLRRVETLDGNRMPPLAHHRVDQQGAALLREWIASLSGPPVLAPPAIAAPAGAAVPVAVELTHPDAAATIRYTLDGSAPRASSPVYQSPIRLERPTTVRARAFRDGFTRSIVTQQTFIR